MKPPREELPLCCYDGHHLRRFLPVPETPAEEALVAAYDDATDFPTDDEVAEAVRRFTEDGPTTETWEWVRRARDRQIDA